MKKTSRRNESASRWVAVALCMTNAAIAAVRADSTPEWLPVGRYVGRYPQGTCELKIEDRARYRISCEGKSVIGPVKQGDYGNILLGTDTGIVDPDTARRAADIHADQQL